MRMHHWLQTSAVALTLLAAIGAAGAQQQPQSDSQKAAQGEQQQQNQADKMLRTQSGRAGTEEPSAHAPTNDPDPSTAVFINGALAVPGAPADSETVPAKFSEKNAAADKLTTVAYTFKQLTSDERRKIFEALKSKSAGPAFKADVGVELPLTVDLQPVPDDVTKQVPQTKGYLYTVSDGRVMLVEPANRIVVGSIADPQAKTDGAGSPAQ